MILLLCLESVNVTVYADDLRIYVTGESVALLVACRTNNRNVVGSMPADVVCFTVDRYPPGVNCPLWPATTPSEL